MSFIILSLKSIQARRFMALLTISSIALSTALLLSVEKTKRATEESFTQSISQTDLLVGARTGPLNLILFTLFNIGSPTNSLSWQTYQELKERSDIEWTIPYSLGDGHKGFRVIGTDENFYEHYRFRGDHKVEISNGKSALDIWDVTIGSEVAEKLNYKIGDKIVISHGDTHGEGMLHHDDKPFTVVGILKNTGTPIDQTLYISLYGMEAMHVDWESGVPPKENEIKPQDSFSKEKIKIDELTAFFVRAKSKTQILQMQRDFNEYFKEPLTAIIPSATLTELWLSLSHVDQALKIISILVLVVGLSSMLGMLLSSLNERRREMSILRALGVGPTQIFIMMTFETLTLTTAGVLLGLILELGGFFILQGWIEHNFGLSLQTSAITQSDFLYLVLILLMGLLAGVIPSIKASEQALKDGLTIKV